MVILRYIANVKAATWQLFIACDKWLNACIFLGSPDETISSRADKAMRAGKRWGCILCRVLSKIQKNHCQRSLLPDAGNNAILPDDLVPPK